MPDIYLVLRFGPLGFEGTDILLTTEPKEAYAYTRGEGQALVFRKIDGDYSTEFAAALRDGRVMQAIGGKWHRVSVAPRAPRAPEGA